MNGAKAGVPASVDLIEERLSVTYAGETGECTVSWSHVTGPLVLPEPYRCVIEKCADDVVFKRRGLGQEREGASEFCRLPIRKVLLDGAMIRLVDEPMHPGEEPRTLFINIRPERMQPGSGVIFPVKPQLRPVMELTRTLPWIRSAKIRDIGNATVTSLRHMATRTVAAQRERPRAAAILMLFALSAFGGVWLNQRTPAAAPAAVATGPSVDPISQQHSPDAGTELADIRIPEPQAVAASKVGASYQLISRRGQSGSLEPRTAAAPRKVQKAPKALATQKRSHRMASRRLASVTTKKSDHRKKTARKIQRVQLSQPKRAKLIKRVAEAASSGRSRSYD